MNQIIASTYDASKGFFLPVRRINGGLSLQDLSVLGVEVMNDESTTDGYQRCMLPGWTPVQASESMMQVRLHDSEDRLRAKIFYKPGSEGGRASMEVWSRYTVALKTDERFQWAEVLDGNDVIFSTGGALRSERNLDAYGFNTETQPEHIAASAWLAARFPEHKNPLAYWN